MGQASQVFLLSHPADADLATRVAAGFDSADIAARIVPVSARSAASTDDADFQALAEPPTAAVAIATDALFADLFAVDFLAGLARRRPVCLLMTESIPIPLGFGDAYVALVGDPGRLARSDWRALASPHRPSGRRPARLGAPWSRLRPVMVNHLRLVELTEPRFQRYAAILVAISCLMPIALVFALFADLESHRMDRWQMLKQVLALLAGLEEEPSLVPAFLGLGVIVFGFLLLLQFATSRQLQWRNSAVSRSGFRSALWICALVSALVAIPVGLSQETGPEVYFEGLPALEMIAVVAPRLIPPFLVFFLLFVAVLALLILAWRLAGRLGRTGFAFARRIVRRAGSTA